MIRANATMPELRRGAGGVEAFARIEGHCDLGAALFVDGTGSLRAAWQELLDPSKAG